MFNIIKYFYYNSKFFKSICYSFVLNIFVFSISASTNLIVDTNNNVIDTSNIDNLEKQEATLQTFLNLLKRDGKDDLFDAKKEDLFKEFKKIITEVKEERDILNKIDETFSIVCDLAESQDLAKEELKAILINNVSMLNELIENSKFVNASEQVIKKIGELSNLIRFLINKKYLNLGSLEKEFQDIFNKLMSLSIQIIDNQKNEQDNSELKQDNQDSDISVLDNHELDKLDQKDNNIIQDGENKNDLQDEKEKSKSDKISPKLKRRVKRAGKITGRVLRNVRGICPGGIGLNILSNLLHHRDEILGKCSKL